MFFELTPSLCQTTVNAFASSSELFGFAPDFVECAAWADDIKSMGLNAFDEWHYVDTAYIQDNIQPPPLREENLTWAIPEMVSAYTRKTATDGSRSFALRMLVHCIGDMSQVVTI